jgi:5-methylcytosine-specific restriction endonuclease McrA
MAYANIEDARANGRKYWQEHREELKAKARARRLVNPEVARADVRRRRAKNKAAINARSRELYAMKYKLQKTREQLEKENAYHRSWYKLHREEERKRRELHREGRRIYSKAYYRRNIEKMRAHAKSEWQRLKDSPRWKAYREKSKMSGGYRSRSHNTRAGENARRARESGAEGKYTEREWTEILDRFGWRCLRCGAVEHLTVDHVIPLKHGGSNYADNLQPLCASCNSRKYLAAIDYRPIYCYA